MHIQPFYDPDTATISYVVSDPESRQCAIIDPVLDYDPEAGTTATASADRIIAYVQASGLTVAWLLETHIHADHLTAAAYLKQRLGGKTGIGARIVEVLEHWRRVSNIAHDTPADGSQFDRLFADGERFAIGGLSVEVLSPERKLKALLTRASRIGARFAVIVGENELERGVVQIRDLVKSEQREIPEAELPGAIAAGRGGMPGARA